MIIQLVAAAAGGLRATNGDSNHFALQEDLRITDDDGIDFFVDQVEKGYLTYNDFERSLALSALNDDDAIDPDADPQERESSQTPESSGLRTGSFRKL